MAEKRTQDSRQSLLAENLNKECTTYTTQYSPLFKDVNIKYEVKTFNGSFLAENIYRQPASPEVDEAWNALGIDNRPVVISASEAAKAGLSSHYYQRSQRYGGGYIVEVEGLHRLHCLDVLRKSLWYNYEYYKARGENAFRDPERYLRLHASHCVDSLRQALMCTVDTSVFGQVWFNPKDPRAFPDFHTRHKCKNFDSVRQWATDNQVPPDDELPDDYVKPPNPDDVLPASYIIAGTTI
ncbi:hypothetical protein GQ53DRAFT_773550 [Thozetella sp. PMI_491]|nr:hypothetical protein GQ53DRAFT_773550 [Thozetella sp. PMI_491]